MHFRWKLPELLLSPVAAVFMFVYMCLDASNCSHYAAIPIADAVLAVVWAGIFYLCWINSPYQESDKKKQSSKKDNRKGKNSDEKKHGRAQGDLELGVSQQASTV